MAMFNPPHPGGLIAEYLEDNDISLRSLANQLGVSAASLSKVASGKASVSPEMAVRLEAGLGMRHGSGYPCRPHVICIRREKLQMFPAFLCIQGS